MLNLTDSINLIPYVGPAYVKKLKRLEIETVVDLLQHYPRTYLDRTHATDIDQLEIGLPQTVVGVIENFKQQRLPTGKTLQKAQISDQSGKLEVTWFNQTYLERYLKPGKYIALSGKTSIFRNRITMTAPEYELLNSPDAQGVHTGKIVPVYPETAGVSSKWLRSRFDYLLAHLKLQDPLPSELVEDHQLLDLKSAYQQIHQPKSEDDLAAAQRRLGFDELLTLQLQGEIRRRARQAEQVGLKLKINPDKLSNFIDQLPFKLTSAQDRAIQEITQDLIKTRPMNRLVEGDVGSGKTVVAAAAAYLCYQSKARTVLMAPTEILAQQHYQELSQLLSEIHQIPVGIYTSNNKDNPEADVIVGTHALLYLEETLAQIGLVVVDEQHRFGVNQRAKLSQIGNQPHRLTMSATPIPRTVALTLFGDLDVSIIDEMPPGRQPIKTWVVPQTKHQAAYQWIDQQIETSQAQVYVVCPVIEESQLGDDVVSVTQTYQQLKQEFPHWRIGLLHGRLKADEKETVLDKFSQHQLDVLVATQVIEVGVNVPKATIMSIESAHRFGLAQLHQLRGRVGRGDRASYCLLHIPGNKASSRLKAVQKSHNGFKLAEMDLKLRGPGEVFGLEQHGWLKLKQARLTDKKLTQLAQQAAKQLLKQNPKLTGLEYYTNNFEVEQLENTGHHN